jgi:hypothetical protein
MAIHIEYTAREDAGEFRAGCVEPLHRKTIPNYELPITIQKWSDRFLFQ